MLANSLLVSIPGGQLGALPLPGSLFAWRHLRDAPMRPELRLALALVTEAAAAARAQLRFVARPEIFTHGRARAWLDERLGGIRDHLILTDGETLRTLPGLDNHMFFYARGLPEQEAALARLLRLAPELFAGLAGQVNGNLSFRLGARWIRPKLHVLRFGSTPGPEQPLVAPFLCHAGNPARAAAFAASLACEKEAAPPQAGRPHYLPLSASALADAAFLRELALLLHRAALGVGDETILLGLPASEDATADTEARIAAFLRPLAATGLQFPHAPSWRARFLTAPPSPQEMAGGRITLHPATPFWRLGTDLAGVAEVEVAGGGRLSAFRALVSAWLGREVAIRRPAPGGEPVTIGNLP